MTKTQINTNVPIELQGAEPYIQKWIDQHTAPLEKLIHKQIIRRIKVPLIKVEVTIEAAQVQDFFMGPIEEVDTFQPILMRVLAIKKSNGMLMFNLSYDLPNRTALVQRL